LGASLVDNQDAGRDAGAVEKVGRQADDGLDEPAPNEALADLGLGVAADLMSSRTSA
jgi:hypothetical protein